MICVWPFFNSHLGMGKSEEVQKIDCQVPTCGVLDVNAVLLLTFCHQHNSIIHVD